MKKVKAPEKTAAPDLLAALQASLDEAKTEKPAPKRRSSSKKAAAKA